jgi:hypothetical protein
MNWRVLNSVVVLSLLSAIQAATAEKKEAMRPHASNISWIEAIQEHVLVSGESHDSDNNGFPLGNFNVHEVSPQETWVTAPEWDRTGKTVPCDNRLARIVWK